MNFIIGINPATDEMQRENNVKTFVTMSIVDSVFTVLTAWIIVSPCGNESRPIKPPVKPIKTRM